MPAVADSPARSAAPSLPDRAKDREPTVLDELLDAVAGHLTPEGEQLVRKFKMTREQSRRLAALDRRRETAALSKEETTEHFDLRMSAQFGGLLKARLLRRGRDAGLGSAA